MMGIVFRFVVILVLLTFSGLHNKTQSFYCAIIGKTRSSLNLLGEIKTMLRGKFK